jgi:cytochrome c peroxidase
MRSRSFIAYALVVLAASAAAFTRSELPWSADDVRLLQQLSIASLPAPTADPSNRHADDVAAAAFGQRLFFDARLSANGKVACASCHDPARQFQDGLPLAQGVGTTARRTMSIVGASHSPWQFWDGRKDTLWSQALGPLESAVEHGGDRTQYARLVAGEYRHEYETIFGALPPLPAGPAHAGPVDDPAAAQAWHAMPPGTRDNVTRVFANMGKAIEAYERRIEPGRSRFDDYADAAARNDRPGMEKAMNRDEIAGLKLFLGKANCIQCHSGPLFTSNEFHNTGVPAPKGAAADDGRRSGSRKLLDDEFNCLGRFSDAKASECGELRFLATGSDKQAGQFRVPSLRNVAERAPYMHAGQFRTLREVVEHYNAAPAAPVGHSELHPLGLTSKEIDQLAGFLGTLGGPVAADARWLRAPTPPAP